MSWRSHSSFSRSIILLFITLAAAVPSLGNQPISLANVLLGEESAWGQIRLAIYQSLGHLILTAVAIILAYYHFKRERMSREVERLRHEEQLKEERLRHEEQRNREEERHAGQLKKEMEHHEEQLKFEKEKFRELLSFEKIKFDAESKTREEIQQFRAHELDRFSDPAADIAGHLADKLAKDPGWAYRALESAKLLPYKDTLFDERTHHFRKEKQELATRFTPLLLERCKHLIINKDQDVWLLIDAGTTLFPFFELIGTETAKLSQKGEEWLKHLHLATNNLPGIEQLIRTGRRIPFERYSNLAIEGCYLLPGSPIPIFAAVAGDLTKSAIQNLPVQSTANKDAPRNPTFIALVVGNWIRIRTTQPRIPVPMARGVEHREVKQEFINKANEVYVISPLGKIFMDYTNREVNDALGFGSQTNDAGKRPYEEVIIKGDDAKKIKLVTTHRTVNRLLFRHSCKVEDVLKPWQTPNEEAFVQYEIADMPHLSFQFHDLPKTKTEEFTIEFPHYHTRTNQRVLEMFSVKSN